MGSNPTPPTIGLSALSIVMSSSENETLRVLGSLPKASLSGCSSVWLERYLGVVEVASSNPVIPSIDTYSKPSLRRLAGSSPVVLN